MTIEGQAFGQLQIQGNAFTWFCDDPRPPTEMEAQGFAAAGPLLSFHPDKDR